MRPDHKPSDLSGEDKRKKPATVLLFHRRQLSIWHGTAWPNVVIAMLEMGFPLLMQVLWKFGSSNHIWSNYYVIFTDNSELHAVKRANLLSERFQILKRSPARMQLVTMTVQHASRTRDENRFQVQKKTISNLRYVDDIVLVVTSCQRSCKT